MGNFFEPSSSKSAIEKILASFGDSSLLLIIEIGAMLDIVSGGREILNRKVRSFNVNLNQIFICS